jgi:putative transposase
MTELKGKKRQQPSSCPEDWLPDARVVQLELTCRQERYARRAIGIARFVYNRMVAGAQDARDAGLWLTPHELEKEFNAVKKTNPALEFVTQVSKFVAQGACRNYRNAHSRWRNRNLKARKPVFHRKKRTGTGSFLAASGVDRISYDGHRRIRLPYLGSVRMTRPLPEGIPHEVTVRKQNGRWYASIAYWAPPCPPPQRETQSVGGLDVGITPLAVESDGVIHQNPKSYQKAQKRLRRWQRAQARRTPGCRGWWEAQRRIDSIHRRITGIRNNVHHHLSRALVRKYHTLGIESLNVAGMIRAGLQSKALSDAAFSSLLRQIRYKAQWYGTCIVAASRTFPSSKTCSACGAVNRALKLERRWTCPNCGVFHDRNENAARNLLKLALLAVGENVMLPDGEALAGGGSTAGETTPVEGRTKPRATIHSQPTLDV